jgi:hypothetical protein
VCWYLVCRDITLEILSQAASSSLIMTESKIVEVDYNDLVGAADITSQIAEAYGFNGLGILLVKNGASL